MTEADISLENEKIQEMFKLKTRQNAVWGGKITQGYKDWFDENQEEIKEFLSNDAEEESEGEEIDFDEIIEEIEIQDVDEALGEPSPDDLFEIEEVEEIGYSKDKKPVIKVVKTNTAGESSAPAKSSVVSSSIPSKVSKPARDEKKQKPAVEKTSAVKIDKSDKVKIISAGVSPSGKQSPTVFTASFEEEWVPTIKEMRKQIKEGIVEYRGHIIIIGGDTGAGKTHLAVDMVNVPEMNLGYRRVPSGRPVFVISTGPSPKDEILRNYAEHYGKTIFFKNCYIEDKKTGLIDPIATLNLMNRKLSALKGRKKGTVIIEDWTLYCALMLYSYMVTSGGKEAKGISFNEFLRPEKPLSPTEHQYKARLIDEILLSLENKFPMNIVLVANLKDEIVTTGSKAFDFEKTGDKIEDMQKGSDRRSDIVVRMWKQEDDEGLIKRHLLIKKSRFEGAVVKANEIEIISPTAKKLINEIVKLYLKRK